MHLAIGSERAGRNGQAEPHALVRFPGTVRGMLISAHDMLGSRRVLAIIVARGGSKGLPRKNVLPCGGKPLIAWSIEAASASKLVDRAIVSSDDAEILATARQYGGDVPFERPADLATDTATMDAVVLHALDALRADAECFDVCVLLQATSPLRTAADIDGALETMARLSVPSVASVTPPAKPPYWMYSVGPSGLLQPLLPELANTPQRQALPPTYVLNGAVYAVDVRWLAEKRRWVNEETAAYVMPPERSIDIDTALDLIVANALLEGAHPAKSS